MTDTELHPGQLVLIQPGFERDRPWVGDMNHTVGAVGRVIDSDIDLYAKVQVRHPSERRGWRTWYYQREALLLVSTGPMTEAEWLAQVGA